MTATGGLSDNQNSGAKAAPAGQMSEKQQALAQTLDRIERSRLENQRPAGSVSLVAVSKKFDAAAVLDVASGGQMHFGENYVQEGCEKIQQIRLARPDLVWHFIGPLQSNKTQSVAQHFDWVDSVDRLKIAQRLSEQRPAGLAALQVCIQINISGEVTKSGCHADELTPLALAIAALPKCQLRGLMCIPEATIDSQQTVLTEQFKQMNQLFAQTKSRLEAGGFDATSFDTLSMGMSGDLELAIQYGSTSVRVGTAIFGARPKV